MLAAIKHGLGNLANFQGRDARQAFWYYVLFLYLVTMALTMAITLPMTMQAMMVGVQQGMANAGNPDRAAADVLARSAIAQSMGGYVEVLVWVTVGASLLMLVGLAASFVRRLHDSNLPGTWALLPGVAQLVNLVLLPRQLDNMNAMMTQSMAGNPLASFSMYHGAAGIGAVLGYGAMIMVVVFGVRKSTPGPNRYGEAPFTA